MPGHMSGDHPTRVSWSRRVFTLPNLGALAAATAVFTLALRTWDSNRGAVLSALIAAAIGGVAWVATSRATRGPTLDRALLGTRQLGSVPDVPGTPAPTILEPGSRSAAMYREIVADLEANTTGQIVMVTAPSPGQGSTTVALNLAVAATQAGRRVLLIDGDPAGRGISRFMGTGRVPGLTELAAGETDLKEAARMWQLDDHTMLPVLPAGAARSDAPELLAGPSIAAALDTVSEQADLVLVDASPITWDGTAGPLAAHADGTVLVVTAAAQPDTVATTTRALEDAGAPLLGFVVNKSDGAPLKPKLVAPFLGRVAVLFVLLALGFSGYTGTRLWASWQGVERGELDTAAARTVEPLPDVTVDEVEDEEITVEEFEENVTSAPAFDGPYQSVLLIGGDEVAGAADVILLTVLPNGSGQPFMVSLPRDLYLHNECTGSYSRINATIHGCDAINGETNLALTVETFTGIQVDHFAKFDFDGFAEIIDAVGGIEICVEYAVRDSKAQLSLPAGCTNATGDQALSWVRSRHTQQQVNGSWKSVPGAGDLLRNQHQQEVLLELFDKLKSFSSPNDLASKVNSLTNAFALDDGLGIAEAIGLAWSARAVDLDDILRIEVDVKLTSTRAGQSVLIPTRPFEEVLREANPAFAADLYGDPDTAFGASDLG